MVCVLEMSFCFIILVTCFVISLLGHLKGTHVEEPRILTLCTRSYASEKASDTPCGGIPQVVKPLDHVYEDGRRGKEQSLDDPVRGDRGL